MLEFFAMGGYAWYVWMAYGAVALVLAVEVALVRARRRRAFEELRMSADPRQPPPSILHPRSAR
jgi:heme exporter protein D